MAYANIKLPTSKRSFNDPYEQYFYRSCVGRHNPWSQFVHHASRDPDNRFVPCHNMTSAQIHADPYCNGLYLQYLENIGYTRQRKTLCREPNPQPPPPKIRRRRTLRRPATQQGQGKRSHPKFQKPRRTNPKLPNQRFVPVLNQERLINNYFRQLNSRSTVPKGLGSLYYRQAPVRPIIY